MKFNSILLCVCAISLHLFSQDKIINVESEENDQEHLIGITKRNALQVGEFGEHFLVEYKNYHTEMNILNEIGFDIYTYDITLVLATWCHDSKEQVPRFFKVLDILDYNTKNIKIICVNKEKNGGDVDISSLNIELVPTFIFTKNDIEIGRIIETPINSFERDIVDILNN